MHMHNYLPHLFVGAGFPEGMNFVTSLQEYRCNKCGETITLPDCGHASCRHLMSHGCKGSMEKIAWKAPIKSKAVYEDTTCYPAKRKGNVAKKRK